jgi:hypothetical protein
MSFYLQKHPGLRFHAEYNLSWQRFHIWLMRALGDGSEPVHVTKVTLETKPHEPGEPTEPAMNLSLAEAQALFDSLWQSGLRPKDWGQKPTDVAGVKDEVIAAQKEHINDLRNRSFVMIPDSKPEIIQ